MTKPLKVLQLIDSLHIGGAEVLAVNIANVLASKNIQSHLCSSRKEGPLKSQLSKEIGTIHLKRKRRLDLKALLRLVTYIKTHKIRIIHAHSSSLFLGICCKVLLPSLKIYWHVHSGRYMYSSRMKTFFFKLMSLFVDCIITVNQPLHHWVSQKLYAQSSIYLPNFASLNSRKACTNLNGVNEKRIVMVAGLRRVKDHLTILNALKLVILKKPDWTLHFIGKDYEDAYAKEIHNFIQVHQLEKNVFLYGSCEDIPHILSQATIGVLSSESEGLPVSLLEYGLAGLPVVVTDVGECRNVVGDSTCIVPPKRSDIFATALLSLIQDEQKRKRKGKEFYNQVTRNYSENAFFRQLIQIYTSR